MLAFSFLYLFVYFPLGKQLKQILSQYKRDVISLSNTCHDFAPAENWLIMFSYKDQKCDDGFTEFLTIMLHVSLFYNIHMLALYLQKQ